MKGVYRIIDSFGEEHVKLEVGEDVFQPSDGGFFIAHEFGLTVRYGNTIWLMRKDLEPIITALQAAKDLAEERVMNFYQKDEAEAFSLQSV